MRRSLLVYATRYGLTETIFNTLALVLGPAQLCPVQAAPPEDKEEIDFVVLGTPIYNRQPMPEMGAFIEINQTWLRTKPIALLCTALMPKAHGEYLRPLVERLGKAVVWTGGMGGRIALERLTKADQDNLSRLPADHRSHPTLDCFDPDSVIEAALQIKTFKDRPTAPLPANSLREAIEAFLQSHTTATLVTGTGTRVRGTPIEYTYCKGALYMLSEGGIKFANLLLNPQVCVTVYDAYTGMAGLHSLQMAGIASFVNPQSEEFLRILALKGLPPQRLAALPVSLHMIRVVLRRVEFLNADFKAQGYDIHQVCEF